MKILGRKREGGREEVGSDQQQPRGRYTREKEGGRERLEVKR